MNSFNIVLAIASFGVWAALYIVFYQEKVIPWLVNHLTRDKPLKKDKIDNGYFADGTPIPFRENLFPPTNEDGKEASATTDTSAPHEDPHHPILHDE